jgi:DNA polymerase elongation subunit (family B)
MSAHLLVSQLKELANELNEVPSQVEFLHRFSLTRWQVEKHGGWHRLCEMAGVKPRGGINQYKKISLVQPREPKVLVFDIETSAMLVKVYGLKQNGFIPHKRIKKLWHLYSYAGKFLYHDPIYYLDNRFSKDVTDDRQLIEGLHDLISRADILCGHNLDRFDIKKFNTRAAKWGLPAIIKKPTFDTLKLLKKRYDLPSYSLDYVGKYFEFKNRKSGHGKYPGDELWDALDENIPDAWEECEEYNKQDVLVTEELFFFLAKNDSLSHFQAFTQKPSCSCGSQNFYKDGETSTKQGLFQVYRCHDCKSPFVGKENLIDKDLRKGFFK